MEQQMEQMICIGETNVEIDGEVVHISAWFNKNTQHFEFRREDNGSIASTSLIGLTKFFGEVREELKSHGFKQS